MIKLVDFIEETAPHGSGIDFDYTNIKINTKGKISFENAYHLMDDNGMYIATIPFRITIDRFLKLKVQFIGLNYTGWNLVKKYYWLKGDLKDIYNHWSYKYLSEIIDIFTEYQKR